MDSLKVENFEIRVSKGMDGTVKLQWTGRSEARNPGDILNPYLDGNIGYLKGKNIIVDFTKLEFMNSSTVPPIIKFIKNCSVNEIPAVIHFDKNSEWQNASFKPLQTVCMVLKNIKVEGV